MPPQTGQLLPAVGAWGGSALARERALGRRRAGRAPGRALPRRRWRRL